MLGGAADPKARGLEVLERTDDVGDPRDGQVHDGAGGSLIGGDRHLGRALARDDHARGADDLGGAHDGAEVARIGHVVENDHERRAVTRALDDVREVRIGELPHLERDALVGASARDLVELDARDGLDAHARLAKTGEQLADGGIALDSLGDERTADGETCAQGLGRGAASLDEVARDGAGRRGGARTGSALASARGRVPAAGGTCLLSLGLRGAGALRPARRVRTLLRALLLSHIRPPSFSSIRPIVTLNGCMRPAHGKTPQIRDRHQIEHRASGPSPPAEP